MEVISESSGLRAIPLPAAAAAGTALLFFARRLAWVLLVLPAPLRGWRAAKNALTVLAGVRMASVDTELLKASRSNVDAITARIKIALKGVARVLTSYADDGEQCELVTN